mmetsp:Transcript_37407/g.63674  ORF Transcript_37407/g.63674 Transcript_37407/m.63674 type:complete len:123 (-) Transcript_37407:1958-2326(-)
MSSSCDPISTMVDPLTVDVVPSLAPNTTIRSAFLTVERRCAMMMVVIPPPVPPFPTKLSIADCTTLSDSLSNAEVASSRMSTDGLRINALAMAMRCFCPPLNLDPRAPTFVLNLSGNVVMKS